MESASSFDPALLVRFPPLDGRWRWTAVVIGVFVASADRLPLRRRGALLPRIPCAFPALAMSADPAPRKNSVRLGGRDYGGWEHDEQLQQRQSGKHEFVNLSSSALCRNSVYWSRLQRTVRPQRKVFQALQRSANVKQQVVHANSFDLVCEHRKSPWISASRDFSRR